MAFLFVFIELLVSVVRQVVNLSPPEWIWGFAGLAASHSVSFLTTSCGAANIGIKHCTAS